MQQFLVVTLFVIIAMTNQAYCALDKDQQIDSHRMEKDFYKLLLLNRLEEYLKGGKPVIAGKPTNVSHETKQKLMKKAACGNLNGKQNSNAFNVVIFIFI